MRGTEVRHEPGTIVLERGFHQGKLRFVLPVTVLADDGDTVVWWLRRGSTYVRPLKATGEQDRNATGSWTLGEQTWSRTNLVSLTRWGRAHALGHFFDESFETFLGWYVNLQRPYERDDRGFRTEDHALDIWVPAETGEPQWKDEDEFAEAVAKGAYDGPAVRAEGERVWAERPWPTGWEDWRPPADWTPLALPEEWDVV